MNMNKDILSNYFINPFIKAWNLCFDFNLFKSYSTEGIFYEYTEQYDSYTLYFVPAVGLFIGLCAYFFSWIIATFAGTVIATIICPLIITIFIESLNHGKDSKNLVDLLAFKFSGQTKSEYFHEKDKSYLHGNFMYFYIFLAIFIIRILCLGSLIYFHRIGWLIIVFTLSLAIQGYLILDDDYAVQDGNPGYAEQKTSVKFWIITGLLCLVFGCAYFFSMLVSLIVIILIALKTKNILKKGGRLNRATIGLSGKSIEILLLLLGLVYKLHF